MAWCFVMMEIGDSSSPTRNSTQSMDGIDHRHGFTGRSAIKAWASASLARSVVLCSAELNISPHASHDHAIVWSYLSKWKCSEAPWKVCLCLWEARRGEPEHTKQEREKTRPSENDKDTTRTNGTTRTRMEIKVMAVMIFCSTPPCSISCQRARRVIGFTFGSHSAWLDTPPAEYKRACKQAV